MPPAPSPTADPAPLVIARIDAAPARGWLSIGPCPGRRDEGRDLVVDLATLRKSGATHLITLTTQQELEELGVGEIGVSSALAGLVWHHLPIVDFGTPDAVWDAAWQSMGPELRTALRAGSGVHLHCRGGCGRSGMIAARLLVELGVTADDAIASVRAARSCAIETVQQENAVRSASPIS